MKRALVLGGGGSVGIAWESGLIAGLYEGGVDVREADRVVGTSAGSVVGARVAARHDLASLGRPPSVPASGDRPTSASAPTPDMQVMGEIFSIWSNAGQMTTERLAAVGALALRAQTVDEQHFVDMIARTHGVHDWPEHLQVSTVDAHTGEFVLHDSTSGGTVERAVAASCAVPGMFPPVEVAGRTYFDGGVRSGTSADAVLDLEPDLVFVIVPMGARSAPGIGALAERQLRDEVSQLRAAGTRVLQLLPEDVELAAFGPNLMNPAAAEPSRKAGFERGVRLAREEAAVWNG